MVGQNWGRPKKKKITMKMRTTSWTFTFFQYNIAESRHIFRQEEVEDPSLRQNQNGEELKRGEELELAWFNILISVTSWLLYGTVRVGLVHLSDLITFLATVTAIDSASTIYKGGAGRSMGLRDLLLNSIIRKRWQNSMFAYTVMSWLSSVSFDAVILYGEAGPLRSLRNEWSPPLHFFTHVAASFVRDEYSTWWQVALVVSVLEEDQLLFDALLTSSKLRKGNRFRGFVLMLVYFGWRCLRSFLGMQRSGVAYAFIDRGLFCLGKVMNWVACTVYYHNYKNRQRREVVAKED